MLTDSQKKRYSRQIALAEIGKQGQEALLDASVLVVGAGGLGCPALQILATSGVGKIGIIDNDYVELSNLHRQFLYQQHDVGRLKAEIAVAALAKLNDEIILEAHVERLGEQNVASLVGSYDIILDGCDNFTTRFLVNRECVDQCKPLVSGAVSEWQGQVALFLGYETQQPCYQCFCPAEPPASGRLDCSMGGVTGALTAVVGAQMAMVAIKHITHTGSEQAGVLIRYDALKNRFTHGRILKDTACLACA